MLLQDNFYSVYSLTTKDIYQGDAVSLISGYTMDYSSLNNLFFLKHNINVFDKVDTQEVCYKINNILYCLKGGISDYYDKNVQVLYESFGEENCTLSTTIECSSSGLNASVFNHGGVNIYDDNLRCYITYDNFSGCMNSGGTQEPA